MKKIINDVAKVLNSLYSINMLKPENVTSTLDLDSKTHKYSLTVNVFTLEQYVSSLCLEMFQEIRKDSYEMSVVENDQEESFKYLSVCFYEP